LLRFASAGARSEATRRIAEKVAAAAEAQTVAAAVAASGRQPHLSVDRSSTISIEESKRLLVRIETFLGQANYCHGKQTEISHGLWKRCIVVVAGYPAPNYYLACHFYASLTTT
jgi:hypothetical protein